jgi:tetratricopeptide (TPR) repeat protein
VRGDFEAAALDHAAAQQIRQRLLDQSTDDLVARDFARGAFNQGILENDRENWDPSARHFEISIAQFRKLVAAHPESLSDRFELAVASVLLGDVLSMQGVEKQALDSYESGRGILEQLASENPQVVLYRERIGTAVISEAEYHLDLARRAAERQPLDAATASVHLASAESLLGRGVAALAPVVAAEPRRAGPRHDLAAVYLRLGEVKKQQGDPTGARSAWIKGCEVLEPIKGEFDRNLDCAERWGQLEESLQSLAPPQAM